MIVALAPLISLVGLVLAHALDLDLAPANANANVSAKRTRRMFGI